MYHTETPLSGASIYVITDRRESCEVDDSIQSLGGIRARQLKDATHALWIPGDDDGGDGGDISDVGAITVNSRMQLKKAKASQIPVVDSSWLTKMSVLDFQKEHWSEVDISPFIPPVVALIEDDEFLTRQSGKRRSRPSFVKKRVKRDSSTSLGSSIGETLAYLKKERPDILEEDAMRRAKEMSMLDFALVHRKPSTRLLPFSMGDDEEQGDGDGVQADTFKTVPEDDANEILGIPKTALPSEIRTAYRRRALETHPDRGGTRGAFESVARAYRSLLDDRTHHSEKAAPVTLKSTAHWDQELRDHRDLVEELFQSHGADVSINLAKQNGALEILGLEPVDAGSTNLNENGQIIYNSCFYLSLATSYLDGIGALTVCGSTQDADPKDVDNIEADAALIGETALQLKRMIERIVVSSHPEWAVTGQVGEDVQAFSDFLVYVLDSPTLMNEWAVAIFDTVSGFVDIYKGKNYDLSNYNLSDNCSSAPPNTLTVRYVPGHYQPLIPCEPKFCPRPPLEKILATLDETGVFYVVTDGAG